MNDYIDKKSSSPYYAQLKEILIKKINNDEFPEGKLWPEKEIAQKYQINVLTVRKALDELVNENRIIKYRGVGSFINRPSLKFGIAKYITSEANLIKEKNEIVKILKKESVKFDNSLLLRFDINNFSEKAVYINRLRLFNELPAVLEFIYLNFDLCSEILKEPDDKLLIYNYIENKLGIILTDVLEFIKVKSLKQDEVKLLKIKDSSIIEVTRLSYTEDKKLIEFRKVLIINDIFEFSLKIR